MQPALEKINNVPGVLGSFVAGAGSLKASAMPVFFGTDALAQTAEPMLRALAAARDLAVEVKGLTLHFGDTRVVVSSLDAERLVFVVCQEDVDAGRLNDTLEALSPNDIRDALSFPSAPQPPRASFDSHADWFAAVPNGAPALASGPGPAAPEATPPAPQVSLESTPKETPRDPDAAPAPPPVLTPNQRARLQRELARFVGPVASLLVADIARPGIAPTTAVQLLSREIDSDDDRASFLAALASLQT